MTHLALSGTKEDPAGVVLDDMVRRRAASGWETT
jgi:hypothetical protein